MINIKTILNDMYLDYFNNYLTFEKMAEVHGISKEDLKILLELGKKINNKEYKEGE